MIATSTTTDAGMATLSWNGLDGIAATGRGLLNANRGVAFVVQTTHARKFALAHWLVGAPTPPFIWAANDGPHSGIHCEIG